MLDDGPHVQWRLAVVEVMAWCELLTLGPVQDE